jgi:NitT/TauT family transport system substrate-binding protein
MREHFGVEEFALSVLLAETRWLEANADTARRLARAVERATQWATQHLAEEIREKESASLRTEDASVDAEAIRFTVPMLSSDGVMRPEMAEAARRVLSAAVEGSLLSRLDLKKTYTNQFIDSRSDHGPSGK